MPTRRDLLLGMTAALALPALPGLVPPALDLPLGVLRAEDDAGPFVLVCTQEGPVGAIKTLVVYKDRLVGYQYVAVRESDGWVALFPPKDPYDPDKVPDRHALVYDRPARLTDWSDDEPDFDAAPVGTLMLRRREWPRGKAWVQLQEGCAPDGDAARLLSSWTRTRPPGV